MSKLICMDCGTEKSVKPSDLKYRAYYCEACDTITDHELVKSEQSIFARITASPETLAETLVYNIPFVTVGGKGFSRWHSALDPYDEDIYYYSKEEAIAATVAKLKEVAE